MRILFLTHRLPYAPNRGDRIRAYHLLKTLSTFAEVTLFSLVHDDEEASHVGDLSAWTTGVHVARVPIWRNRLRAAPALFTSRPMTHVLLDAPGLVRQVGNVAEDVSPDVVFAYCSGMARLAAVPQLAIRPLVHDMVDVDSAKWATLADRTPAPLAAVYRREARVLGRFEREVTERARLTLVVNDREHATLGALAPGARIETLENGVDVDYFARTGPAAETPTVVFTGVFNYGPNQDAALWLIREIWPRVLAGEPAAQLAIVGAGAGQSLVDEAARAKGVVVTGAVPDVRPYLHKAAVSVAPLRAARGLQNKVLEALAAGLPVVTTSTVATGLPPRVRESCLVADDADRIASAILRLFDAGVAERLAVVNRAGVGILSWEQQFVRLAPLVRSVVG